MDTLRKVRGASRRVKTVKQELSTLILNFQKRNIWLVSPANTSLDELKKIAAEKCQIQANRPFTLEYFDKDPDFNDWIEVPGDPNFRLPTKGKLRATLFKERSKQDPKESQREITGSAVSYCTDAPESGVSKQSQAVVQKVPEGAAGALISRDKLWIGYEVLNVFFIDDETFGPDVKDGIAWGRGGGEYINISNIMDWANVWSHPCVGEGIPYFKKVDTIKKADIRVEFGKGGECWSLVGTDAMKEDAAKPTMRLNLGGTATGYPHPSLQRSLVIHEFGHALGLEHEHQRSDFWDILEKHLNPDKVPGMSSTPGSDESRATFGTQWARKLVKGTPSKYDPLSIMHYCFEVSWLKDCFQKCEDIDSIGNLSPVEKEYIKGIHEREKKCGPDLPKDPSLTDFMELQKAYRIQSPLSLASETEEVTSVQDSTSDETKVAVHCNKIWKDRQSLKVYFMNEEKLEDWRCRGEPMTVNTIIAWARVWNVVMHEEIPTFDLTYRAKRADIRVEFSDRDGNWSMVGVDAMNIPEDRPTMCLNLVGHTPEFQESLVIHSFGNALGLEHEHQRSEFWNVIEKHLDIDKMKKDPQIASSGFERNWYKKEEQPGEHSVNSLSEYDPQSIMHYRFDIKWFKKESLGTIANIENDANLTEEEKRYLRGIHMVMSSRRQLPQRPSKGDYKKLQIAYGSTAAAVEDTSKNLVSLEQAQADFKVWSGRENLRVYFMNPDDIEKWRWKCRGEFMDFNVILAWARVWNSVQYQDIPFLERTDHPGEADIRVKFSNVGGNWSMVGIEAEKITDFKEPTMQLNLGGYSPNIQESLVIHSFGHALGLENEHQRSDFWNVLEDHLDIDRMAKDLHYGGSEEGKATFTKNWLRKENEPGEYSVNSLSEYDPTSIMHYRFNTAWIKNPALCTYRAIDRDVNLGDKEKTYLKGLLKRSKMGELAQRPSEKDYLRLVKAYSIAKSKATMSFSNAMSTDQLMVWLNSRGVSQKDRDLLKANGLTGASFPLKDREDFERLGIGSSGSILLSKLAIKALQEHFKSK